MTSQLRGSGNQPRILQKPWNECTLDGKLWIIRANTEETHRQLIHLYGTTLLYYLSVRNVNSLPKMTVAEFVSMCNKSVPVYFPHHKGSLSCRLLRMMLHNYIYRRWFRPFRSEIERQRFICQFIGSIDLPSDESISPSTINTILSMNEALCNEVEARRHAYNQHLASGVQDELTVSINLCEGGIGFHVLQPLFRALLIIVPTEIYINEDSKNVGRRPVVLVRTGVEDGLSAPITFEPLAGKIDEYMEAGRAVKVALETAIDFVMGLEAREAAVFGLQPDPVATWSTTTVGRNIHLSLGEETMLKGPSSRYVDPENYPQWLGGGARFDTLQMAAIEQREISFWRMIRSYD